MTEFDRFLLSTFPPQILSDIIKMESSGEINKNTARKLLDYYWENHVMCVKRSDFTKDLDHFIETLKNNYRTIYMSWEEWEAQQKQ